MKIRTDFVTNSSSSSYCFMTISLKDKTSIDFVGEDGATPTFQTAANAKKRLEAITSIAQLVEFLDDCCDDSEAAADFFSQVNAIDGLENVTDVFLEFGEFFSEDADYYGGSFQFNFKTKTFKKTNKPDKDWLEDMFDIYGYDD